MDKVVWLIVFTSGLFIQSALTQTPAVTPANNVAEKAGAIDVTLTCSYANDDATKRKWYKTSKDNDDNLFPDGTNVASTPVTINTDKTELTISSATTTYAGIYICLTADAGGANQDSKSSYLEVLTPDCDVTSDGATPKNLEFSCGASYAGDWKPVLEFGTAADGPNTVETGKKVTLTGNKAVTDVTAGTTWNCKATMRKSNLQNSVTVDSSTDNVEVTDICSWTLGPPSQVTITSDGSYDTLVATDTLTCSASGTPSPTFAWTDGDGTALSSTATYVVKAADVDKTLTCTASNAYGSPTVTFPASTESTKPPAVTEITEAPVTGGSRTLKFFTSALLLAQVLSLTMLEICVFM